MKKQYFILVLMLAFFAGITKVNAQCTPSPNSPAAGVPYEYTTAESGTNQQYDWYVTKNVNVLDDPSIIAVGTMFTVDPLTPYHLPATGVNKIKITWTADGVADGGPFYLVLRYSESSSSTPVCTVENLRVTEIKPINTFLLAFEGAMLNAGNYTSTAGSNACAAGVVGATVTPGASPSLLIKYGQNTLYYVATASGIVGDWYPQIRVPALGGTQTYVSVDWSADMTGAGGWNTFGPAASGGADLLSATKATVTNVTGTPILIRIVIDNVNYRTEADQAIQLALDGFLPPTPIAPATSKSDITSASDCTPLPAFGRTATFTITKRPVPTITPTEITVSNP